MHRYKVSDNKLLTSSVRSVTLTCDDDTPLLHAPGQYAAISLRDQVRPTTFRCFSIASSPTDLRTLQFCARVGGKYTAALERLKIGDEVAVRGPFGGFVFNEKIHRELVLFAGGIGITPFMSMIRYASSLGLKNNIHLIYSCRTQEDIPFFEELVELERRNPRLRITFVITGGSVDRLRGLEGLCGRIDNTVLRASGAISPRATYMVCGPSGFINTIRGLLESANVPSERILSEVFGQGSRSQSESLVRWPANAYALSGISLMLAGFFIAGSDLTKTLPTLQEQYGGNTVASNTSTDSSQAENTPTNIQTIKPQVDTNTTQAPIVRNSATKTTAPTNSTSASTQSSQTKTATPTQTTQTQPTQTVSQPTPTPTPVVVTPTYRPRTRVS